MRVNRRARFKSARASATRKSGKETTDHHFSIILARTSRTRCVSASLRSADIINSTLPWVKSLCLAVINILLTYRDPKRKVKMQNEPLGASLVSLMNYKV